MAIHTISEASVIKLYILPIGWIVATIARARIVVGRRFGRMAGGAIARRALVHAVQVAGITTQ